MPTEFEQETVERSIRELVERDRQRTQNISERDPQVSENITYLNAVEEVGRNTPLERVSFQRELLRDRYRRTYDREIDQYTFDYIMAALENTYASREFNIETRQLISGDIDYYISEYGPSNIQNPYDQ